LWLFVVFLYDQDLGASKALPCNLQPSLLHQAEQKQSCLLKNPLILAHQLLAFPSLVFHAQIDRQVLQGRLQSWNNSSFISLINISENDSKNQAVLSFYTSQIKK